MRRECLDWLLVLGPRGIWSGCSGPTWTTTTPSPEQFASWAFTTCLKESGLLASMGSIGDCFDNAVAEAFWARMQVELLNRKKWRTRVELANVIFEYFEIFHNRQRRHSSLGMRTPIEYEMLHQTRQSVA